MQYKHLSILDREKIQELFWLKKSVRYISKAIGRSLSSVSKELRRNFPKENRRYTPRLAHERALFKRTCRGRTERLKTCDIREYVIAQLKEDWSPEQISGTAKEEKVGLISYLRQQTGEQ